MKQAKKYHDTKHNYVSCKQPVYWGKEISTVDPSLDQIHSIFKILFTFCICEPTQVVPLFKCKPVAEKAWELYQISQAWMFLIFGDIT